MGRSHACIAGIPQIPFLQQGGIRRLPKRGTYCNEPFKALLEMKKHQHLITAGRVPVL